MKITEKRKTKDWNMEDLDRVLKTLKKGQSRDAKGLTNEIFMMENLGSNLKKSILVLVNKIKNWFVFTKK